MGVIHLIGVIVIVIGIIWLIATGWNNVVYNTRKLGQTQGLLTRFGIKPMNGAARRTVNDNSFVTNPQDIPLNGDPSARYLPIVEYAYTVGGVAYRSDRLVFQGKSSYTAGETRAMASQLSLGQPVTVLYNINRPSESYLFVGKFNGTNYITALILIVIGAVIVLLANHSAQKKKEKSPAVVEIRLEEVDTPMDRVSRYRAGPSRA